MTAPRWTEAELSRAEAMVADGLTYARIAQDLGRSHSALRGAMSRFGRRTADRCRAFTMAEVRRALALRAEGLSYREIGERLQRNPWSLRARLVKCGQAPGWSRRPWSEDETQRARRMLAMGRSHGQIALALGRSRGSVSARLRRMAIEDAALAAPACRVSGGGNPRMGVGSPNACIANPGAPERRHVAPGHAQTWAARQGMTGECRHAATAGGETPGTHSLRAAPAADPGRAGGAGCADR